MDSEIRNLMYEMEFKAILHWMAQVAEVTKAENLTEKEILLLDIISLKKNMSISGIAALYPLTSISTISTTVSQLWKRKLVSKKSLPDNQRITVINLTKKGKNVVEELKDGRTGVYTTFYESFNLNHERIKSVIKYFDKKLGM
jgi:DNA-binding MarR family transcriptional regulator